MKKRLQQLMQNKQLKKLLITACCVAVVMCTLCVTAFAVDPAPDDVSTITTGITTIFNSVASNFSFTNLITFLGIAIGSCSVIALGWFGLRKVVSMIQTALKKGKVRV